MAQYNTFNHKNSKLNYLWSKTEQNKNDIDKQIDINLKIDSKQFLKKINKFSLLKKTELPIYGFINIELPEWMVASIKPTAVFYYPFEAVIVNDVEEDNISKLLPESVSQDLEIIQYTLVPEIKFNYLLQSVCNNSYIFQYVLNVTINDNPDIHDNMVANLDIIIMNSKIYQNIQKI